MILLPFHGHKSRSESGDRPDRRVAPFDEPGRPQAGNRAWIPMMASCAGSSADRARVIHIEASQPARPALLLMNNRVKSIDHQLDCRPRRHIRDGHSRDSPTGLETAPMGAAASRARSRSPDCRGRSSDVSSLPVDLSLHDTAPQLSQATAQPPRRRSISACGAFGRFARRSVTSNRKKSADRNSRRNAGSPRKRCIKVIARSLDDY